MGTTSLRTPGEPSPIARFAVRFHADSGTGSLPPYSDLSRFPAVALPVSLFPQSLFLQSLFLQSLFLQSLFLQSPFLQSPVSVVAVSVVASVCSVLLGCACRVANVHSLW